MGKLETIESFIDIVEEGGFAQAARKQGVSTAAISRQLALLEKRLGVHLLQRNTRRFTMTSDGQAYYHSAKEALTTLNNADKAIWSQQETLSGDLHIICTSMIFKDGFNSRLQAFRRAYPLIKITLDIEEREVRLSNADSILIGVSLEGPENYVRRKIGQTRYVFVASPAYLKAHSAPKTLMDLHQHRFIQHSRRVPKDVIYVKEEKMFSLLPDMYCNDSTTIALLLKDSLGIAYLQENVIRQELQTGELVEVLHGQAADQINLYMYWRHQTYLKAELKALIDFLRYNP